MSYAYWEQSRSGHEAPVVTEEPVPAEPVPAATSQTRNSAGPARGIALVQVFAGVVGAVFILVGVLGFVPGVTSMFDEFGLAGRGSEAELLGLFQVSALHNVVHLLFGVGVLAARKPTTAQAYLIGGGVLYGVVGLFGSVIDRATSLNFLPFNHADNVLHFGLAAGMIALGLVGGLLLRRSPAPATA